MTAISGPSGRVRAPSLPERWVRLYTRGLPPEVAEPRRLELMSDVYEHLAATSGSRTVRRAVVGRTMRGVVDDLAWRHEQRRTMNESSRTDQPSRLRAAWAAATQAWFAPAAALCGLFNALLAVGILLDEGSTMPGRVVGPMLLLAFAASMAAGLRLRWSVSRGAVASSRDLGAGSRVTTALRYAVAVFAVAGLALAVTGSRAGLLLGALALLALAATIPSWWSSRSTDPAAHAASSRGAADALILLGTLPCFAFFWLVVPALLGLITVVGVVGTGPGARARAAA